MPLVRYLYIFFRQWSIRPKFIYNFQTNRIEALHFEVLSVDADAQPAGEIRSQLANAGTPIGPYDALICRARACPPVSTPSLN